MAKTKVSAESNVYTGLLALAALAVAASAAFIAYMCHTQYGTIIKILEATGR
jgi:hypothetical protein